MKKYNKIISVFTSTINKLEKLVSENEAKEAAKTNQIKVLKHEAIELAAETIACRSTIKKISELLN